MQNQNNKKEICVIGNGGHARSCIDVIEQIKTYSVSFGGGIKVGHIVEDSRKLSDEDWDYLCREYSDFLIGIGQIKTPIPRITIYNELCERDATIVTIIAPDAYVSPYAYIGEGTVVLHNTVVNAGAKIGHCCIINTGAIIEHDAQVKAFCHVSTGAIVNGGAAVEYGSFVGSHATIFQDVNVPAYSIVGAGQCVRK
jgi:sugar O-acyltransferase (sialic acid O-acetyltransferase NeuD family)